LVEIFSVLGSQQVQQHCRCQRQNNRDEESDL
jgi:hypothetical protein